MVIGGRRRDVDVEFNADQADELVLGHCAAGGGQQAGQVGAAGEQVGRGPRPWRPPGDATWWRQPQQGRRRTPPMAWAGGKAPHSLKYRARAKYIRSAHRLYARDFFV